MKGVHHLSLLSALLILSMMLSPMPVIAVAESTSLKVAVSIESLAGIVAEIGGDRVSLSVLLPAGVEPHSFSVTPEIIAAAEQADLIVVTSHFTWESEIVNQTSKPSIGLEDYELYGARLSPMPGSEDDDHHDENHHHEGNPHGYWLLPTNALAIANATRVALNNIDNSSRDYWDARLKDFALRISRFNALVRELDRQYHFNEIAAVAVFPAEAYIAEAFGIEVKNVLQKGENVFISGDELLDLQNAMSNGSIKLLVGSDVARLQTGGEFALQLSQDTGVPVLWWNTILSKSSDYTGIMNYNLGILTATLDSMHPRGSDMGMIIILGGLTLVMSVVAIGEAILLIRRAKTE